MILKMIWKIGRLLEDEMCVERKMLFDEMMAKAGRDGLLICIIRLQLHTRRVYFMEISL
jgi:hypothetical protein